MVVHLSAARLDFLSRAFGVALALEMVARGVLAILATLDQDTVFQITAGVSFPFTLLGGGLMLVCHLGQAERPWRYALGAVGHFLGVVWAFMFGGAILISWLMGVVPTALAAPMFLVGALVHGLYVYTSVEGARWTRKPL